MFWISTLVATIFLIFGIVVFRGSPYVPSHRNNVKQAFNELYVMGPNDLLVDIGSGDGVILREAAKTGAKAIGFEINPILVLISRLLSKKYEKIHIKLADFWLSKLPVGTTVVYVFSVTRDLRRILSYLQKQSNRLKKPLYVISYGGEFDTKKFIKKVGAHSLYLVEPLQSDKAQV